jgi:cytochrome c oxidase accessory protein FixG
MSSHAALISGAVAEQRRMEQGGLSTLNADGSRHWLRPRPSRGRFWRRRQLVAYVLIAIFTLIPYLHLNGKPLVLLDIVHRQFTFFGYTFLPTDTLLLALLMVGIFVGVFLATAVLGRVWCGWACPQTVYMEFVFRPIERLFEGEPGKRRPLIKDPAAAKAIKFVVYLLVSMFLAHIFLAYFVGIEQLVQWVQRSPLEHPTSFIVMAAVTGLMLFDFGFFREQMCIVACPYGRFQSVMLDRQSLIVGYDSARGEPRGKAKKQETKRPGDQETEEVLSRTVSLRLSVSPSLSSPLGDCVDCRMCVNTCPTGIDIRNGLQMECIACAQCIDACDAVMAKLGRPLGLIRYTTQACLDGEAKKRFRPRLFLYPAVLAIIAAIFTTLLITKSPADISILRGPGMPFNELPGEMVSNQVRLKVANRTSHGRRYFFAVEGIPGAVLRTELNPMPVAAGKQRSEPALIVIPRSAFQAGGGGGGGTADVQVRITDDSGFAKTVRYRLLGPANTTSTHEPPERSSESP